jgi:hypothetical protein
MDRSCVRVKREKKELLLAEKTGQFKPLTELDVKCYLISSETT